MDGIMVMLLWWSNQSLPLFRNFPSVYFKQLWPEKPRVRCCQVNITVYSICSRDYNCVITFQRVQIKEVTKTNNCLYGPVHIQ